MTIVTCILIHRYSITLSPLPTHRYTEHCIACKYLLHSIPLVNVVSPLHRYWDSRYYDCMFVNYWYTDTLVHWIPSCAQLLHVLTPLYIDSPVYMHWLSMYSCYMNHGFILFTWIIDYIITHGYSCILVILIIVYVTWIIVTWVIHLVFPLRISTAHISSNRKIYIARYM